MNIAFVLQFTKSVLRHLPSSVRLALLKTQKRTQNLQRGEQHSKINLVAFNNLMRDHEWSPAMQVLQRTTEDATFPDIDVSVVTHNSVEWIAGFIASLKLLKYPSKKLHIFFTDNKSTDETAAALELAVSELISDGIDACLIKNDNVGFGNGHNVGIAAGTSDYILVTNVDLTFMHTALEKIVASAMADTAEVAAWELRQTPFEHPKIYNPLNGRTNWNSHACVLLRRQAFETVGGYSKDIFMYGEDVELSYRFRSHGFVLRYVPHAVVTHHTYKIPGRTKPTQFTGTVFGNFYNRLLYGGPQEIALIVPMALAMIFFKHNPISAWLSQWYNLSRLVLNSPQIISRRLNRPPGPAFSFSFFDYDVHRRGAFYAASLEPSHKPKVTIITRTYAGRDSFLRHAMISVANQTYRNIEHIISEDQGIVFSDTVNEFASLVQHAVLHVGGNSTGRSSAGNNALALASGDYVLFLDDDDQLYCDHVETLVNAISNNPGARLAYALAFDIPSSNGNPCANDYKLNFPISHQFMERVVCERELTIRNLFPIQSVMFERKLFEERGGFDEDLDLLEDWALWQKYFYKTSSVYIPKTTSFFRTPLDQKENALRVSLHKASYQNVVTRMTRWREVWDKR